MAESCTGGLLGAKITNVPGSSSYFKEGVICYSNQSKCRILGVSPITLKRYGAVSKQAVLEMARGIKNMAQSDYGLSISGIAGPTGGTKTKPVGLIYIGLATPKDILYQKHLFHGDRQTIRERAALAALDFLCHILRQ